MKPFAKLKTLKARLRRFEELLPGLTEIAKPSIQHNEKNLFLR